VLFGLGDGHATKVQVRWPNGRMEEWSGIPVGRYTTLHQGTGTEVGP